ncbi:hypothetical protein [Chryseobacterium sp. BIGb0232]|uniref:hypothetical protein n=1 Tax=Chryseobacterium sp. BIGb0232 TaxID=2940598 RepID=UPI000F497802|nr:hypothetical protein [Chryseobacterium sp. BIGb0232]MCS4305594.1 hypothetical protein [Chryseobacterium sp. BIGb0232]ROS20794.1 hypothetical protein EDF65_1527 [Chryseobacterium nakagawai]
MDTDFSLLLAGAVLLFILISIGISLYLKQKRNLFFRYMKKRKHQLVKNVEISFENQTTIDVNLTYRGADIIFLEDEIFVIPFNRPILHLNSNPEIILPGTQKFKINSRSISNDLLEVKVNDDIGSMQILLNLKNKNIDSYC